MDAIAFPSVTVPRAAHAAGLTTHVLRALMAGPAALPLLGQPCRGKFKTNRFAPADVVRLAIVRRLLDHGITRSGAAYVLDVGVDPHLGGLLGCGIDLPPSFLFDRLDGLTLHVARRGAELRTETTPADYLPRQQHDTTLTVDVGAVARDALARLNHNSAGRSATTGESAK